jgi:Transposase IS66 family
MAEAINYALGQWNELNVFCSDGAVPIDNNVSEREMKRIVLNRKNSLFVGNPRGGRTAAIHASLTSTCRRHDIDPQLYFTQLLVNLSVPGHPLRCGPETSVTSPLRWRWFELRGHEKTYIHSSRPWECGNPEGISKECGKGWEAGFMAFHAFHTLSFPWPAFRAANAG